QQDISRMFRSLEKNGEQAKQLLTWIQDNIYKFIPKSGEPLLPSSLCKLGAVFASVTHGPKNASKANTYASETLRHSSDNHTSLSKRYTIVNMQRREKIIKKLERDVTFLEAELEDLNNCVDKSTVVDLIHEIVLTCINEKGKSSFYSSDSSDSSEESDSVEIIEIREQKAKKYTRELFRSTEKSSSKKGKKTGRKKISSTIKQLIEELLTDILDGSKSLEERSESINNFLQLSERIDHTETKNKEASQGLIFSYFNFGKVVFKQYKELKPKFGKDGSEVIVKKEVKVVIPETKCSDEALQKRTERSEKIYKLFNSIGKEKITQIKSIPPSFILNLTVDKTKYVMAEILMHK
ncbi:16689_t:CDS:2, partial [Cetraspora pellucida]